MRVVAAITHVQVLRFRFLLYEEGSEVELALT
jgi:hypothetical protein